MVSHRRPSLHSLEAIVSMPPPQSAQEATFSSRIPSLRFLSFQDSKSPLTRAPLYAMLLSNIRKWRLRAPLIALLGLLTLAMFAILHQHLNDPQNIPVQKPFRAHQRQAVHRTFRPLGPQIALSPQEELAAVISFMTALPSNALPSTVNISYVDPDLVLDFDTRSPKAPEELKQVVSDTWRQTPTVLLSKQYSPIGREIKAIMGGYNLKPPMVVFNLDERADESVITPVLYRLTQQSSLPILLIDGKPVGAITTIRDLQKSGELRKMIAATSATIDGSKKKKGKR